MRAVLRCFLVIVLVALPLISVAGLASAQEPPAIQPDKVDALIFPGESLQVGKTVTTPQIAPKPDIYFLADTTGSMSSAIANVQLEASTLIPTIAAQTTDPRFGAGDYKDFPFDPYVFSNAAPIPGSDDGGAAALGAIAGWSAGGGADGSEGQFYALDRIADGAVNWRPDATKIVVWFGDWPAHDPVCAAISGLPYDITEASLIAKLVAAGIRVLAIGTTTGLPDALNGDPTISAGDYSGACAIGGSAGQANRIAAATGGISLQDVPPDDVAAAILAGLQLLPAEVSMASNCVAPISTTFVPPVQTVTSGDDASFVETIAVAAGTPGGTLQCQDFATVNGELLTNGTEPLVEAKTIHVPGIDATPDSDINELGFVLDHTVVGAITAGSYGPVVGVRVEFAVGGQNAGATGAGFTDGAGQVSFTYAPPIEPTSLGDDTITACFTDLADTVVYGCDTVGKQWVDITPPAAFCVPGVNPAGKEPNAPGKGGQGQNQDGFYSIYGDDVVWPDDALAVYVTDAGSGTVFGPYPTYTNIKYVQAPGGKPNVKPGSGAVDYMITGNGDALVNVVDGSGNVSAAATCLVPPKPK